MCVAQNYGFETLDSVGGYQIQEAEEGQELTHEQKEKNWALGGQSYEEAFGEDPKRGRGSAADLRGRLGDIAMQAHRQKLRAGHKTVRRPAPSAPIAEEESDPGQGYSIKGKTTQDDVSKQKYDKKAGAVSSVKKGAKKLKSISAAELPKTTSDKSGLNI
jgi:hypothetical protein